MIVFGISGRPPCGFFWGGGEDGGDHGILEGVWAGPGGASMRRSGPWREFWMCCTAICHHGCSRGTIIVAYPCYWHRVCQIVPLAMIDCGKARMGSAAVGRPAGGCSFAGAHR